MIRKILRKLRPVNPVNVAIQNGAKIGKHFNMLRGVIIDPDHAWHITIGLSLIHISEPTRPY